MKTRLALATVLATIALLSLPPTAYGFGDPPTACFEVTVQNCFLTVCFDASCSTDDNGIWKYDWFFGDGTSGSGETVCHTFPDESTYTVRLIVWDGFVLHGGDGDSTTMQVTPTDCN